MNKIFLSMSSAWIVALVGACSGSSPSSTRPQDGGSSNATVGGGTATAQTGGSQSGAEGGTTVAGGSVGTGGVIVGSTGGTTQSVSTGGVPNGQGGAATGGSTDNPSGGNSPTGGKASTGGSAAGGGAATGGSASNRPAVYTSTNGSCVSGTSTTWTPGTISTSTGTETATVTVDDSSAAQTWEGFGGCFNEKGWQYLQQLSATDRDRAMKLLFAADGANFNLGRIPMGASDYALARYTDDEGGEDTSMANFNATQDAKYLIPYIQAALAIKSDIKFWASPWTPPTWMKTGPYTAITDDDAATSSNFDSGNMTDNASYLTAYAQYFVNFINAYKSANINISVVAPQNEPNYGLHYPSCIWTAALFTKFVGQYLGPALSTANPGVSIMLGTMSNSDINTDPAIVSAVIGDSTAWSYIKVLGYQWIMLPHVSSDMSYGKSIWQTEHKCGNYPWITNTRSKGCGDSNDPCPVYDSSKAPNDQAYGVESWKYIRNWIKAGVTAYSAWNMVLDTVGDGIDANRHWNQNALLTVDTSSNALGVTPAYCVFRHFSQFVDVGATVVGTSGGDAVAFKNPNGSIVAVMYNSGAASDSYTVSIGGQKYQFSMPANGWATVVK